MGLTDFAGPAIFAQFVEILEEARSEIDAAVEDAAREIPPFAALLERIPAEQREADRIDSRARERLALCQGEWDDYLANLRRQGALYADMGIEFEAWFGLLRPYREVVLRRALPAGADRAHDVLTGMSAFLDIAIAALGESYVERKERLVRQSEERLTLYIDMFRNASVAMVILDVIDASDPNASIVVAANPRAAALSGPTLLDPVGKRLSDLAPDAIERGVAELYGDALRTGDARSWIASRQDPLGERRTYECRCFPIGARHVGVIYEDVTNRQRMQVELRHHVRELERSNRELDQFAYVASHDLKAPLRDIQNLAGWLREDSYEALPEASRRHLSVLCDRVTRMERLLDDLLDYSRAGRIRHQPEEIGLRGVIEGAVALAAIPAHFRVEVESPDLGLHTPRAPLEQVFRNLISNAVKHHDLDEGVVRVRVEPSDRWVSIAVSDDGPGIPEQFHERVFGMFTTLRPRDDVEGSGMGLAIVKKVIEAHGGTVALEPGAGRGTTVRFTWPRSPEEVDR